MTINMDYKTLKLGSDARGVATLTLAREEVFNAFDELMIDELTRAFAALGTDPKVRVVVLAAAGKAFSAGADLRWMERTSQNGRQENLEDARRFARMMQAINECSKPVVGRVQGAAYGGGVGLCCACDIVFASSQSVFSVSEAKFGILPSVIGPYLTNAVGKRQALRLALTAQRIDAAHALRIGLVHQVAETSELDGLIEETVAALLLNGPAALGEIKALFGQLEVGEITEQVRELTAQTIARVRATDEAREGFAAFFAKRAPSWGQR
jgi:methylglutaconyl-CoA hydratase